MKITVKPEKKSIIKIEDMPTGTVFEFSDEAIGLKLNYGQVVLLNGPFGYTWLEVANGYLDMPIKRILGQISEIIVE